MIGSVSAIVFDPIESKTNDAKMGISQFERDIKNIEKEIASIKKKITIKSLRVTDIYSHYYTLYKNPLRYVNQFFLSQAKPDGVIIVHSSVLPDSSFTSIEKNRLKPYLSNYGISKIKNLNKIFSVVRLNISARGSFQAIGEYLHNIYQLPIKFSLRQLDVEESESGVVLRMEVSILTYRLQNQK